ncbi:cellulase family glycosylhydrolase [Paenarthrobacter sp. OM7]|uniref:glycoside hydrolase 5 family protein n=1 Tax=Paenarthrobacter sp. OM7 TaxID=3041264 RepID=UPI0024689749|nr:cellulase family glycosylhydrolase [Paenarthrobacter sp. OM7]WGM20272.1 cellulase family glycosylhydrolase [Paenarthrobacter sp. OM7]
MTQATRFGVNYVPSKGWWYSWNDWIDQDFQDDFQAIAQLGCDHVRVHCLWPLLQPNPGMVSNTMLDRLVRLLDLAEANGMDVIVTVFNGWLSGFDFRPSWLHDNVNIFTDEAAITAQLSLLDSLAKRVGTHPRFLGFDVANEPCVLATSTKNVTTQPQGDAWVRTLLDHCQQLAPGKLHSVGMDHAPWLAADVPFGRPTLANTGGLTPIHAWSYFTGALEQYGPLGTGTLHLAEFMLELAKAFQDDPTRPVWLQEYGVANDWMTAQERETYVDKQPDPRSASKIYGALPGGVLTTSTESSQASSNSNTTSASSPWTTTSNPPAPVSRASSPKSKREAWPNPNHAIRHLSLTTTRRRT